MTRAGIGFIVGGVVLYLLGVQTQIGWFYLVDALVWSMVALSAFIPWWSLRGLRIERQVLLPHSADRLREVASPREDETVEVRLRVSNGGRLARHFVKVVEGCPLEGPDARPRVFLLSALKARSSLSFSYVATCYRRGRYTSAWATLETAAPMGIFIRRRRFDLPLRVTIYPAYYRMEGTPVATEAWSEQGQAVRASAASEFYGSREYRHGDPLRHIHWRNTARLGQFVVKEFEQASQASVAVAFETRRDWGAGRDTTLEYSIRIAASLARRCADLGQSIGILAGQAPLLRADWPEAMDYLAGLEVGETTSLEEMAVTTQPGQTLVVIAPAAETDLIPSLRHLAGRERRLVVVLLEGFIQGERPQEFLSQLGRDSGLLVRCARGELTVALETLGRSWLSSDQLPVTAG
ncbi:MAG: DUF58 domain-containing protein [Chloroflexi bacterium]|nr:DUF58 domain-containing protein [Chloroflexota bacterium]